MKEDFLRYLWRFQKFRAAGLQTSGGEKVTVLNAGQYLRLSGPGFFNSQMIIAGQKWAGNVEIHTRSSDWYSHRHETDPAYENVILYVVWENDAAIFRKNNTEIPVLELKNYVPEDVLDRYRCLVQPKSWIFCEKELASIDHFLFKNWQERLFLERLERKSRQIDALLTAAGHDWEAVLFCLLAKNFGLNANGNAFLKIARDIPFSIIRKESFEIENLEALLFGTAGLLDAENESRYFRDLRTRYHYLRQKYRLAQNPAEPPRFFRHRPDNFPTIRLSQLAALYGANQNLFSKIIASASIKEIYGIFDVAASGYWQSHYRFDKPSPGKKKPLARSFIGLVIINTVVPLQFAYAKSRGKEIFEKLAAFLNQTAPESNAVIGKFSAFGVRPENALGSQSLLELKNEYCGHGRCLECAIGLELLKT